MKKSIYAVLVTILLQVACLDILKASTFGSPQCDSDGAPLQFRRTDNNDNLFIIHAVAILNQDAELIYNYNAYYGIGGTIIFQTNSTSFPLISWGNEFSESSPVGSTIYKGHVISCYLQ